MATAREKIEGAARELGATLDYEATIAPGDLYLAARNGPAQLLTCAKIAPSVQCGDHMMKGWIMPVEAAYCFDFHECVKVVQDP